MRIFGGLVETKKRKPAMTRALKLRRDRAAELDRRVGFGAVWLFT